MLMFKFGLYIYFIFLKITRFSPLFIFRRTICILFLIDQIIFRIGYILNCIRLLYFCISRWILFIQNWIPNFFVLLLTNKIIIHVFLVCWVLNVLLKRDLSLYIFVYQIWFLSIFIWLNILSFDYKLFLCFYIFNLISTNVTIFFHNQIFWFFIFGMLLRLEILLVF